MTSLPKDIKNIYFFSNKNSPKKKISNRPHSRLGRIQSKGKKKAPIDTNSIYTKNSMLNSILEKNLLMRKTTSRLNKNKLENINSFSFKDNQKIILKKRNLNFNKINKLINKEKQLISKQHNSPSDINKKQLKTMSAKVKDMKIENNKLIPQNNIKIKNFFEDIKIKNIINLWNELEVLNPYRKYFCFIYKEIDDEDQDNLYQNEINELIELKNDIKNLTYNIELRFGIIKKLSELNTELNNEIKNNKNNKVNNFIINEMLKEIEELTEQTINIVVYMKKIKTKINNVSNLGKYNIDIISKKYHFDKNYLIKMKAETNFLREGYAKVYFNLKNEETPFFLKMCDNNNNNNKTPKKEPYIQALSLNENTINQIKECSYYIYQELIAYQNDNANKKVFRCISPLRKNNSAYNYSNINFYHDKFIVNDEKNQENENEKEKEEEKEKEKEKEKDKDKEEIIINGSGLEINKEKIEDNMNKFKRNSKDNMHNSVKLINSYKNNIYSIDNSKLNRKNKKLYTHIINNKNINNINNININNNKKNRNSDILHFKENFESNNQYNDFLNNSKSEINLKNKNEVEISKKRDRLPSFSPTNESNKDEEQQIEEDIKEE